MDLWYSDAAGEEWRVRDLVRVRDPDRYCLGCASAENAVARYFIRYEARTVLEVRRYRFRPEECRWHDIEHVTAQFAASELREITPEVEAAAK